MTPVLVEFVGGPADRRFALVGHGKRSLKLQEVLSGDVRVFAAAPAGARPRLLLRYDVLHQVYAAAAA